MGSYSKHWPFEIKKLKFLLTFQNKVLYHDRTEKTKDCTKLRENISKIPFGRLLIKIHR